MLITGVGTLGKTYVVTGSHDFYFKDGNIIWLKVGVRASSEFLHQLYLTPVLANQITDGSAGTTVGTYTISGAKKTVIPLPPTKAEQEAIAEALSDADALIESLQQLIAKQRAIKQGAMQALLTGRQRLPGFGGEWRCLSIADLERSDFLKLSRGHVISKLDMERQPGAYPIYSSSVHNDGLFGAYGRYMFDEELVTWSVDGGGDFFYRERHRFSVTNVCGFMRADTAKLNYRFLAAVLQQQHHQKYFDYTTKAHPSVIRDEYSVPMLQMEEQIAIAAVLSDMDAAIDALEARLAKTRALKAGMLQQLLTGWIRLVPPKGNTRV